MLKKTLLGPCIILCIAVFAITAMLFFTKSPEAKTAQPNELLLQYFSGISDGQYEALYNMLSEQSQITISKEDFVTKNKNIYEGIEAKNISISITGMFNPDKKPNYMEITGASYSNGTWKVVEYAMRMDTVAGEISYNNHAVFSLNEEKEYRMEWTPGSIFPSLTGDDKVRVNTLQAKRGNIYDRNGAILAGEGMTSSIGLVPGKMNEDSGADIIQISELLEMSVEDINKILSASYVKEDTFVPMRIVSKDRMELKNTLLLIPGIKIIDKPVRYYPLGEKAAHLIGYIQGINAEELETLRKKGYHMSSVLGRVGMEKIYEEQLRAVDGYEIIIVDKEENIRDTLARMEKVDGKSITLTIDAQIQSQLYDRFAQDKSCSVAMNPKTGEILALVSTPTYNANDFVLGMSMSQWTALNEDENKPMYNRFMAALCPGSTFKAVTAAIGVNTGVISPSDDFGHSGLSWQKDASWGGYYITTTKEYYDSANLEHALVYSDNIYFGKAALKIGADLFAKQLVNIGFEERIPFEYGLYSSIISSTETFTSEIQLADSGFGQGQILTNPIHLASIYSAFVNEGSMIQPYLIFSEDPTPAFWKEHAFTSDTATIVRNSLIQVVERGTATDAKINGVTLAGKTGTAEVKQSKDDLNGTELGWFVLFTADDYSENPFLVISMVEDVKERGGSHYVVPRVKTIFEYKMY